MPGFGPALAEARARSGGRAVAGRWEGGSRHSLRATCCCGLCRPALPWLRAAQLAPPAAAGLQGWNAELIARDHFQAKVFTESEVGACSYTMHTLYDAARRCGKYDWAEAEGSQQLPVFEVRRGAVGAQRAQRAHRHMPPRASEPAGLCRAGVPSFVLASLPPACALSCVLAGSPFSQPACAPAWRAMPHAVRARLPADLANGARGTRDIGGG